MDYLILSEYDYKVLPTGEIVLKPKSKKNYFTQDSMTTFRTDSEDNQSFNRDEAEKSIELSIYRLENSWRSDSDPLKFNPPTEGEVRNLDLNLSFNRYRNDLEDAWKTL